MQPNGNGADAPIELRELRIGACSRIAREPRERIHAAMRDGELPFSRDNEGHQVATLDSLIAWMGRRPKSPADKVAA